MLTTSPIKRVAVELLVEILLFSISYIPLVAQMNRLISLRRVCKHWQTVIESHHQSHQSLLVNSWSVPVTLGFFGALPLDVAWCITNPKYHMEDQLNHIENHAKSVVSLLGTQSIRSLYLSFTRHSETWGHTERRLFGFALRSLQVDNHLANISHLQLQNIPTTIPLPTLDHYKSLLSLESIDTPFPLIPKLTTIPLQYLYLKMTKDIKGFQNWVDLLQGCTQLSCLHINPTYTPHYAFQDLKQGVKKSISSHLKTISFYMFDGEWNILLVQLLQLFSSSLTSLGVEFGPSLDKHDVDNIFDTLGPSVSHYFLSVEAWIDCDCLDPSVC
jgi:hypothetical protein